ncbi:MAG: hypothetical protein ACEPO8_08075 [Rhodothermaceae bacterium]
MLYEKFIRLVENHAEDLTAKWIEEVGKNPSTPGYHNMNNQLLEKRVFDIYQRLGEWLLTKDLTDKKSAEHFIKLGSERAHEGLKASEVIYALVLTRVVLWKFVINQGVINSTIDMHQALEFYHTVNNFFDKASYFVLVGFENVLKIDDETVENEGLIDGAVNSITRWLIR